MRRQRALPNHPPATAEAEATRPPVSVADRNPFGALAVKRVRQLQLPGTHVTTAPAYMHGRDFIARVPNSNVKKTRTAHLDSLFQDGLRFAIASSETIAAQVTAERAGGAAGRRIFHYPFAWSEKPAVDMRGRALYFLGEDENPGRAGLLHHSLRQVGTKTN